MYHRNNAWLKKELIPETSSGQALILLLKREGLIGVIDKSFTN